MGESLELSFLFIIIFVRYMELFSHFISDAADSLADIYKSAEHPEKAQEVTDNVDKHTKAVGDLQGKITSTQQDLNDKFVKSQVRLMTQSTCSYIDCNCLVALL